MRTTAAHVKDQAYLADESLLGANRLAAAQTTTELVSQLAILSRDGMAA